MIDLKQAELHQWQGRNFGSHPDDALKCALGMAEEVGEVCHHVLKGAQGIRGGINGINKEEVADGVADALIYGLQLLTTLGVDAEKEISAVIEKVLRRNWLENPVGDAKSFTMKIPSGHVGAHLFDENSICYLCGHSRNYAERNHIKCSGKMAF